MATISGTQGYWKVWLVVNEASTSVVNNTSSANWELWLGRTYESTSYIQGTPTINIKISGKTAYDDSPYLNISGITQNGVKLLSGTVTDITHNDNGTIKNDTISFTWTGSGFNPNNVSASGTYTTSTIPRATPAPKFTATVGTPMYINISPKATDTFYHRIHLTIGGTGYWLKSDGSITTVVNDYDTFGNTVTSIKFNAPTSLYSKFTGKSTTGTIEVYTYRRYKSLLESSYKYSQVGSTTSNSFTLQCDSTKCTPVITGTVVDTNPVTLSLTGDKNSLVANASHATITPIIKSVSDTNDTATTINYMYIDGVQFSGDTVTITKPTGKSFVLRVVNSRGYPAEYIVDATGDLIPYVPLTFNVLNLKRTEPTTGEVDVQYDGKYFNSTFNNGVPNELTLGWLYRETNTDEWIGSVNIDTNTNYNNTLLTSAIPDSFGLTFLEDWDGSNTVYQLAFNDKYSLQTVVSSSGSFVWVTLTNTIENTRKTIYRYLNNSSGNSGVQENNVTLLLPEDIGSFATVNTEDKLYEYLKTISISTLTNYDIKNDNTYSGKDSLGNIFDYKKSYEFVLYCFDKLTNLEISGIISRGLPVFWWNANNFYVNGNIHANNIREPHIIASYKLATETVNDGAKLSIGDLIYNNTNGIIEVEYIDSNSYLKINHDGYILISYNVWFQGDGSARPWLHCERYRLENNEDLTTVEVYTHSIDDNSSRFVSLSTANRIGEIKNGEFVGLYLTLSSSEVTINTGAGPYAPSYITIEIL